MELPLLEKSGWEVDHAEREGIHLAKGFPRGIRTRRRSCLSDVNPRDIRRTGYVVGWEQKIRQVYEILGEGENVKKHVFLSVVRRSGVYEKEKEGKKVIDAILKNEDATNGFSQDNIQRIVMNMGRNLWQARALATNGEQGRKEQLMNGGNVLEEVCNELIAAKLGSGKSRSVSVFLMCLESIELMNALESHLMNLAHLFEELALRSSSITNDESEELTVEYQYVREFIDSIGMASSSDPNFSVLEKDLMICLERESPPQESDNDSLVVKELSKKRLVFDDFLLCLAFFAFAAYGDRRKYSDKKFRLTPASVTAIVGNFTEGFHRAVTSPRRSQEDEKTPSPCDDSSSTDSNPSSPFLQTTVEREPASGGTPMGTRGFKTVRGFGSSVTVTPATNGNGSESPNRQLNFNGEETDSLYVDSNSHLSRVFEERFDYQYVEDAPTEEYELDGLLTPDAPRGRRAYPAGSTSETNAMCALDDARQKYDMVTQDIQHIITDVSMLGEDLAKVVKELRSTCKEVEMLKTHLSSHVQPKKSGFFQTGCRIFSGLSSLAVVILAGFAAWDHLGSGSTSQFSNPCI